MQWSLTMINLNHLGSLDDIAAMNAMKNNDNPYYKQYDRLTDPVTTVVVTNFTVLEAYTTTRVNEDKGFSIDTLNLALLIPAIPGLTTDERYIKLKLKGATVSTIDGTLRVAASSDYSSFINLGLQFRPDFLANPSTITMQSGTWKEERTHYNNMVGFTGLMAFSTVSEYKSYYSYGAVFFIKPSPDANPMSAYEYIHLKRNYRQGPNGGDFATLVDLLQGRTNDLFGVDTAIPNELTDKPSLAQQGVNSFTGADTDPYAPKKAAYTPVTRADDDGDTDDIPF